MMSIALNFPSRTLNINARNIVVLTPCVTQFPIILCIGIKQRTFSLFPPFDPRPSCCCLIFLILSNFYIHPIFQIRILSLIILISLPTFTLQYIFLPFNNRFLTFFVTPISARFQCLILRSLRPIFKGPISHCFLPNFLRILPICRQRQRNIPMNLVMVLLLESWFIGTFTMVLLLVRMGFVRLSS
uniref:Uncharacterized protein n=1 Tax=Opuntia streptacantha TaxID=393608 RepID=A0A7C9EVU7_OPUST